MGVDVKGNALKPVGYKLARLARQSDSRATIGR
jgi:hypothetical protein